MSRAVRNAIAMVLGLVLGGALAYGFSSGSPRDVATGYTMPPRPHVTGGLDDQLSPSAGPTGATPQAGR